MHKASIIKQAEININGKWLCAKIYHKSWDSVGGEYTVVFRTGGVREPVQDITSHKYEGSALDKYQEILEQNFKTFPFFEKVDAEISNCENYLYDPQ